jgi:hypothetical protein
LSENKLWTLVETGDGHIWIGSNMGLAEFDGRRFRTYTTENGLTEKQIFSLLVDRQGYLWAGTHSSGVMRLARNGITTYRQSDGLLGGDVPSVLETRGGSLLAVSAQPEQFSRPGVERAEIQPGVAAVPERGQGFRIGIRTACASGSHGRMVVATRDALCRFPRTESDLKRSFVPASENFNSNNVPPWLRSRAIPARLTHDLAQGQLGDEQGVGGGEKEDIFLDRRSEMQQNHDLGEARWRNMTQARQLGVVGDLARANHRVQFVGQR